MIFLLAICILSVFFKCYFIKLVTTHEIRSTKKHMPWLFFIGSITGSLFGDIAWIIKLTHHLALASINYTIVTFFIRIAWGCTIIHYQSLSLFIESLSLKHFSTRIHHFILIPFSLMLSCYFFYTAFFDTTLTTLTERDFASNALSWPFELHAIRFSTFYLLFCITIPSIFRTVIHLRHTYLPRILRKQLIIFLLYLIGPYFFIESLQSMQYPVKELRNYLFSIIGFSTLLLVISMYMCIKKIIGLRFLNHSLHIKINSNTILVHEFKKALEQLSKAVTIEELIQISQHFFQDNFGIPLQKTGLYIRTTSQYSLDSSVCCNAQNIVEHCLRSEDTAALTYMHKNRILIYDDIEFSNFYEECTTRNTILSFLQSIQAELFIPIFSKNTIIAYIIIKNHNRAKEFYGTAERNEMIMFANYLNHIIVLLQTKNIPLLMKKEKELAEELLNKNQLINQYKEIIQSFVYNNKNKKIGIIFYKNRRFIFGNKEAQELIPINLNKQSGHIITKHLKKIIYSVEKYNTSHSAFIKDTKNNTLVISGMPSLEKNNIIITVYYPELIDFFNNHIDMLQDHTKSDYLLYLESTQSGKLINQLIPGNGEQLLPFKIQLLKTALGEKATLLTVPENDLMPTVEVIHHISLRTTLHTMHLSTTEKNNEYAITLFGMNPIFDYPQKSTPALFKKLDHVGTLFIQNIHYLSLDTQKLLAESIRYGYYRPYKSDQTIPCNVRIIASTTHDLLHLVHNNLFSSELHNELKKAKLIMPSLESLSDTEIAHLTDSITEQSLHNTDTPTIIPLSEAEKSKISYSRPLSIHELKERIHYALSHKAQQYHTAYQETQVYTTSHPELIEIAHQGKYALRNKTTMKLLWHTFKNQNKIATFLGVNRSSVNRRCKQYHLE